MFVFSLSSHCVTQAFYDRALTPRELFVTTGQPVKANDPNLLALYSFDEGHGLTIRDRREVSVTSADVSPTFLQSRLAPPTGTSAATSNVGVNSSGADSSSAPTQLRNDAILITSAGTTDIGSALQTSYFVPSVHSAARNIWRLYASLGMTPQLLFVCVTCRNLVWPCARSL